MKLRRILLRLLVLLLLGSAQTHAEFLVPTAAIWRWRPGTNEASSPVNLWREISFDDAEFNSAPAPFWDAGAFPAGTQVGGYSSIFLRHSFFIANVADINQLLLGALVDDGFVAWINGTEVKRVNMPGAPGTSVSPDTLANDIVEPVVFNTYDLPTPSTYLRAGTNVLAVQVFQAANSSLGFECSLEFTRTNAPDALPYISEFMASNTRTLADETGSYEDWLEIYNPSHQAVNLDGWHLTDSAGALTKWRFPATNLPSGGFLVVFASGNDRRVPGATLHTSFKISASGEYLALVKPDGVTMVSEFSPAFPQQLSDVSYGLAQSGSPPAYNLSGSSLFFTTPSPGAVNLGGAVVPGPIIDSVRHSPNVPLDHEQLLVTARVRASVRPIDSVVLHYRIMFGDEITALMFDDGAHGDGAASDGWYGATIPANLSTNGQMIRYLVSATDVDGNSARWPLFTDPAHTEEYLGTIVAPLVTSKLPIFHLFVAPGQLSGIDLETGGRVAFFYDGEFYDNIYMERRGNTSAAFVKKAHRLEFNHGHELRHAGPGGRTRKSSLLAEYLDPAYLRQHLCFWFLGQIGVPAPYDYPVRVQMNGEFYQLAFHSDVLGQEQLERMGYDPSGALYKAVGNLVPAFTSTGGFQKIEPENDPSRTDYLQLADGINETSSLAVRRNTVFDLLDLPQVINYLAGSRWCGENDDVWANMTIYRDTFGDGCWRNIPFDMNISWGQLYGGVTPLQATVDSYKCHPLYGGSSTGVSYNRLYDVIVTLPETRQMLLRRERSIMDQMVQPPGTSPEVLLLENYVKSMTNLIAVEANLDRAKWGLSPWAPGKTFNDGVADLLSQFIGPRRQHWYVTHCITNTSRVIGISNLHNAGIPLSQPANSFIAVAGMDCNPTSGNQEQEYVCLTNPAPFAVDISGWKLSGSIEFSFAPGTVLPSNGVAYVSPNLRAFRARTSGPSGGQGLFVLGPYQGHLSARGETLAVKNTFGQTVHAFTYPGSPSLAQQWLRVTELMFHPPALAPLLMDDFQYIELKNISTTTTLDLSGVRFVNGIDFNFTDSAVTNLDPGAHVLVVKNAAAFAVRYGNGLPVAGQFLGNLEDQGERIQLLDADGEEILDFSYQPWYPLTDGLGFSLEIVEEAAEPDAWNRPSQWRPSGELAGSPGTDAPAAAATPISPVLITEALTRADAAAPLKTIELFNPTSQPADISGWWLSDDFHSPAKFQFPNGTVIAAHSFLTVDESQFNAGAGAFGFRSDNNEVWLFSADPAGKLGGYVHGYTFGAADDGVSFGRYVTSEGQEHFVAQISRSFGTDNSGPRIGPVVINEVMYRPPDLNGTNGNADEEYIELLNTSAGPVPLFAPNAPTNTWRLRGGIDFAFPPGVTLAETESILLVRFDPTDSALVSAFQMKYGLNSSVRLFGPYARKLDNSGDHLKLQKPATPALGVVPYVLVDEVDYRNSGAWPAGADGYGLSLQRSVPHAYGNDPANWIAAVPTAGSSTVTTTAPIITTQPQTQNVVVHSSVALTVVATGEAPLRYQWHFRNANVAEATNATLILPDLQPEQAGDYNVVVFNDGGSVVSSNATVDVLIPPTILAQPQNAAVLPGSNITFSVTAYSPWPLRYQWRLNGTNLPGRNEPSLTLLNVGLSNAGDYSVMVSDPLASSQSAAATLLLLIEPTIVVQPLSQSVPMGGPVTLSVAVTNTATLPLGIRIRRGNTTLPISPTTFFTINSHHFFHTLTGTNAAPPWTNYSFVVTNRMRTTGVLSAPAILDYLADTDGDGLPDQWENTFFGGLDAEPAADSDGDGMSNRAEQIAGTNPTDPTSYLKLDSITAAPTVLIRFLAVAHRTYTVEFNDDPGQLPWQKLADVVASPTNRLQTVPDSTHRANRLYRLATPQQP